ncbi:MAG: transporter substrate-binding domain-containing protein [Dialister invisus]
MSILEGEQTDYFWRIYLSGGVYDGANSIENHFGSSNGGRSLIGRISGCGKSAEAEKQAPASKAGMEKVLRVGGEATYPPFLFKDEHGHYVGFEMDLIKAVAKEIGAEVAYTDMPFSQFMTAVENKKVDVVISAVEGTAERAEKAAFSDVYYKKGVYCILVRKDDDRIHAADDLKGKTVTAVKGSTNEALAKKLGADQIVEAEYNADIFKNLEAGKADAVITDEPLAYYYLGHGGAEKAKTVATVPSDDGFVILMNKEDVKMQRDINGALKKVMENGVYDQLFHKWFNVSVSGK